MKHLFFFLAALLPVAVKAQQVVPVEKFGNNGISLTIEDNNTIYTNSIQVQQDQKLLIATFSDDNEAYSPGVNIRRLKTDGTLDSSFGTNGIVNLSRHRFTQRYGGRLGLQHDGKIIAASIAAEFHFDSRPDTIWIERFMPDGSVDNSFGNQGAIYIADDDGSPLGVTSLQIRPDDKILLVATSSYYYYAPNIRRYMPNGMPDSSFGINGVVNSPYDRRLSNLILLPNNKMIVSASHYLGNNLYTNSLVKYNDDGTIDSSVIPGGVVNVGNSYAYNQPSYAQMQLQHDGKLLLYATDNGMATIYRYLKNGTLDPSFGSNGKQSTITGSGFYGTFNIDIQADEKIIVNNNTNNQLLRYFPDGRPDSSFGINGTLTVPGIISRNIFIVEKNKLIIAGDAYANDLGAIEVAIYKPCLGCTAIRAANAEQINVSKTAGFNIYPNPAKDQLHIQTTEKMTLIIADVNGKMLITKTIFNNDIINIAQLPASIYYIKNITTGQSKKFLKQ